jgi:hypothetical protein
MAREHGLTELEAEQWLRVLHRLGTVIYFDALPQLRDTVFLKPEWVREAAYAILRSEAIEDEDGEFRSHDFSLIWPGQTAEEHLKLIALMQAFELCYVTQDDYGRALYIAPALFPAQPPPGYCFTGLSSQPFPVLELRFQFQPFLPAGLLHRLIVHLHAWLHQSKSWRKGVVLLKDDTYAEITEDWENKLLSVKLKGPAPKIFFNHLRQEVERIVADLKNSHMLHHLEITSEGLYKEVWWNLDQLEKLSIDFWGQKAPATGVRLFISYARENESFKDELIKHLSGMRQSGAITHWDDRQILPGQAWDQEIKEKLENSLVVLFLVSADFMDSDYINDVEIARTIKRREEGKVTIVPVVIHPCDFSSLKISKDQALPLALGKGIKPVSKWRSRAEAWLNVVEGLKRIIGV